MSCEYAQWYLIDFPVSFVNTLIDLWEKVCFECLIRKSFVFTKHLIQHSYDLLIGPVIPDRHFPTSFAITLWTHQLICEKKYTLLNAWLGRTFCSQILKSSFKCLVKWQSDIWSISQSCFGITLWTHQLICQTTRYFVTYIVDWGYASSSIK